MKLNPISQQRSTAWLWHRALCQRVAIALKDIHTNYRQILHHLFDGAKIDVVSK